jgi:hypothetical protein
VAHDRHLAESLERATAQQRDLRRRLARENGGSGRDDGASLELGIGGSANPAQLKCLHAHVAYALANPDYLLGRLILAEVQPEWPESECCTPLEDRAL